MARDEDKETSLGGDQEESWIRSAIRDPIAEAIAQLPRPGTVLGNKYRIERLVGRGGMGAVFRATQLLSERPVALKWMLHAATHEPARLRFVREARAVGRIDHPNVVILYDVCEEPECCYLVMELLRGESLADRLARGRLTASAAVDLLLPAMHGVAAAHRAGVIHRDLKPDNVFLCEAPDGTPREAKVLDFGVSSIANSADATLTQAGAMLGSLPYMSPEQIRDPHQVDARTDVYAFGVLLYEALAGRRPFEGGSCGELMFAIANRAPTPLSQLRPDLPAGLESIVLGAFAREPAARPESMESLIAALRPFGSLGSG